MDGHRFKDRSLLTKIRINKIIDKVSQQSMPAVCLLFLILNAGIFSDNVYVLFLYSAVFHQRTLKDFALYSQRSVAPNFVYIYYLTNHEHILFLYS